MTANFVKVTGLAKVKHLLARFYPEALRPGTVVINTFADGVCNSNCSWCITQYSLKEKALAGKLSFDSFKKFLQLNADNKFPLVPYGLGEPTIHKEFVPFCRYALNEGWNLSHIHSNLASPSLSDDVFDILTGFNTVTVNFGGGTRETQYLNMKTDIDVTFSNLKQLLDAKKANKSDTKIKAKMVLNKRNVAEVDILREKIEQISTDIDFGVYPLYFTVSDGNQDDRNRFFEANLATPAGELDERVPTREVITIDKNGNVHTESKLKGCYGLNPTVHFNGAVTVCCRSRWHEGVVGNAFKEPMKDILSSQRYKKAEKMALKRKYIEYCKFCS